MQPKFTPGPWEIPATERELHQHHIAAGIPVRAFSERREVVCAIVNIRNDFDVRRAIADARLISAAPDMFRALNSLAVKLRALGFGGEEEISGADTVDAVAEAFADIEAALAKAGGRS